jgi:hypothetical protein
MKDALTSIHGFQKEVTILGERERRSLLGKKIKETLVAYTYERYSGNILHPVIDHPTVWVPSNTIKKL